MRETKYRGNDVSVRMKRLFLTHTHKSFSFSRYCHELYFYLVKIMNISIFRINLSQLS